MEREIAVRKVSSKYAGGCNACTAHMSPMGTLEHTVWRIRLGCMEARVCQECLGELIKKLRDTEAY